MSLTPRLSHYFILIPALLALWSCGGNSDYSPPINPAGFGGFRCDVELHRDSAGQTWFQGDSCFFMGGQSDSTQAYRGSYSCRLEEGNPEGLIITLPAVSGDHFLEASVKKFGEGGKLVVASMQSNLLFQAVEIGHPTDREGWEELSFRLHVPLGVEGPVRVFVKHDGPNSVWFDDLEVSWQQQASYPSFPAEETLSLTIPEDEMQVLRERRKESFAFGQIVTAMKRYKDAEVSWQGNLWRAEARIKGDYLDHLQGDKWSFRIKLKGQANYHGLRTFNIQSPHTRDFLYEWVMHRLCEQENVLTTAYEFIPVQINGKGLGVYALEEHFEKQLIERRLRREGPVLKFDEKTHWELVSQTRLSGQPWLTPNYTSAIVEPFRKGKTRKDSTLSNHFEQGRRMLLQFQEGRAMASEIFDLEALAKYYALMDLGQVLHGNTWMNLRWYYNPLNNRLEPIAYDLYGANSIPFHDQILLVNRYGEASDELSAETHFQLQVFNDEGFIRRYRHYLAAYTDPAFLDAFMADLQPEMERYQAMLESEQPFTFEPDFLHIIAASLREQTTEWPDAPRNFTRHPASSTAYPPSILQSPPTGLVQVYREGMEGWSTLATVRNFLSEPVTLIAYGRQKHQYFTLPESVVVPAYADGKPGEVTRAKLPGNPKRVYYHVGDSGETQTLKIVPWSYDPEPVWRQRQKLQYPKSAILAHTVVLFKAGEHVATQDVIIPAHYQVSFEPGANLTLTNGARFLCEGSFQAIGTAEAPILIQGDSTSFTSLAVINAPGLTKLHHVEISRVKPFFKEGWQLTGGITFYGTEIEMRQCKFYLGRGEDLLNLVSCSLDISECSLHDAQRDGLDADFCTGRIDKLDLWGVGNDGLDISTGRLALTDLSVVAATDKALSCGEASIVTLTGGSIERCGMAFASKDASHLTVDDVKITNCEIGAAVYQKKPEYGPADMKLTLQPGFATDMLHVIEKGSWLKLNQDSIPGTENMELYGWY